jgi:hypothetical protein
MMKVKQLNKTPKNMVRELCKNDTLLFELNKVLERSFGLESDDSYFNKTWKTYTTNYDCEKRLLNEYIYLVLGLNILSDPRVVEYHETNHSMMSWLLIVFQRTMKRFGFDPNDFHGLFLKINSSEFQESLGFTEEEQLMIYSICD